MFKYNGRRSLSEILKLIRDEKCCIGDRELFCSPAYQSFLTGQVVLITGRKNPFRVVVDWDEKPNSDLGCTNNRTVYINAGHPLIQSLPSRALRVVMITGILAHEAAHLLYTDFATMERYTEGILQGSLYPYNPATADLSPAEQKSLSELERVCRGDSKAAKEVVLHYAATIFNIVEDGYVNACVSAAYPGSYRTGVMLLTKVIFDNHQTILEQMKAGYALYSIVLNLLIQHELQGEIHNPEAYDGGLVDLFHSCREIMDQAMFSKHTVDRYLATNRIFLLLWPLIKAEVDYARDCEEAGPEEHQAWKRAWRDGTSKEAKIGNPLPQGERGKPAAEAPVLVDAKAEIDADREKIGKALADLDNKLANQKSAGVAGDTSGLLSHHHDDCLLDQEALRGMEEALESMAKDTVTGDLEKQLTKDLQRLANDIDYGNNHLGVRVSVHRERNVSQTVIQAYERVAVGFMPIAKRAATLFEQQIEQKVIGARRDGLYAGKRFNSRSLHRSDMKHFSDFKELEIDLDIAVGFLGDLSYSMSRGNRMGPTRAAGLVIYEFCRLLGIPVAVYGHNAIGLQVDIYTYADFDSIDGNDRYRIMNMNYGKKGNRDGAALQYVANRLIQMPQSCKLLIIASDGQPLCEGYRGEPAEADLRGIKLECQNNGIDLIAAAIGDDRDAIHRIYGSSFMDISNLSLLPMKLIDKIGVYLEQLIA